MPSETGTTDILDRLRPWSVHEFDSIGPNEVVVKEAMDEIERLRTLNAKMLCALDAIAEVYLGMEEIRNGEL